MSTERPTICPVPWAHVVYRKLRSPLLGDACGHFLIALRFIPYGTLFIRAIRGERERWLVVAGFTVFTACAMMPS